MLEDMKVKAGVKLDSELKAEHLRELVKQFKAHYKKFLVKNSQVTLVSN